LLGIIFEEAKILMLGWQRDVTIEKVVMPNALVPMPTDEVYIVAHAFLSFLTWLKYSVGSISNSPIWTFKPYTTLF